MNTPLTFRRTKSQVLEARVRVATETLQQIATLPRGGLAKRLAVATLAFIQPEPIKRFKRITCPTCGKSCSVSKHGWTRSHHHKGEWCKGNHGQ